MRTEIISNVAIFSKCSVDCIHSGKKNAKHQDRNANLKNSCVLPLGEEMSRSGFGLNTSVIFCAWHMPWKKIRTVAAMSCSMTSVNAGRISVEGYT
jgi:hypothetical protein